MDARVETVLERLGVDRPGAQEISHLGDKE